MTGRAIALLLLVLLVAAGSAGAKANAPSALAYASDAQGSLDVYVMGTGPKARPRRLTASPRDEFSPSWSPDGRWLAYRLNPPRGDEGDIWTMRADGTRKRNLTRSPRVADWSPSWSPSASR